MKISHDINPITKEISYCKVKIRIPGIGSKRVALHRLVAITFIPNPDNLPQVNHIDGNKSNNAASNLEWVSAKDNTLHAIKMRLRHKTPGGKDCPATKWSESIIRRICELLSEGKYSTGEIAKITGTNRQLVTSIATKKTWVEISNEYPNIKPTSQTLENCFIKFHDWVDFMIRSKVPRKLMLERLQNEGLTRKESYNLIHSRLRSSNELRKLYYEVNPYKSKSSTTIRKE
jgi:hypothetical protein